MDEANARHETSQLYPKTDQDMYGQNNQYGQQYGGQQQIQNPAYHKPFVSYGVNSNQRPVVVSQGGCCCSLMWSNIIILWI